MTSTRPDGSIASAYAVVDAAGAVITYGGAGFEGDLLETALHAPVVGAAPDGRGYWLVASDGGVFAFGDARFDGSMGGLPLNRPIVGMTTSPRGEGYWLVASDGGIFAFGDAGFFGSMGGQPLNRPIVGMAATPDGRGYWLVASDGGVFAFGDARFDGSMGGLPLNRPIVGMTTSPDGSGYWLVASDGGLFAFGDARFDGSMGGQPLSAPIVALTASPLGNGYWMVGRDGSVYAFGDAPYEGGASSPLHPPLYPALLSASIPAAVAILPLPTGEQAAHAGPARVAFAGDSLAYFEGFFTAATVPGFVVDNGAMPGCGITDGAEMEEWSAPGSIQTSPAACSEWLAQMQWVVQRFHPDAVVVQLGYWECQPRSWDGSFVDLSDPAYAQDIQSNLTQALATVHADGAHVILATSPYFGDGTPAWAVNDFNSIVSTVAHRDSSFVSVLNVNELLDPGGVYVGSIDGIQTRIADQAHLTQAGVQQFIDPELVPLATSLAKATYDGAS